MKKILVVDDEAKIRSIIRKYGEFEGYEVHEASDGMDAINKVKADCDYDVVIMDVMMPELDGFSACSEIKKIKDIPVIMLSARGEEYDRIHGFEAGVDDYVVKPFSPKELMMRVKVVTNSLWQMRQTFLNMKGLRLTLQLERFLLTASESTCHQRNTNCCFILFVTRILLLKGSVLLLKSGDMIIMEMIAP